MAIKYYNASGNFSDISNTTYDIGTTTYITAKRAYRLEEVDAATTIDDIGDDDQDGTRSTNLTQVAGVFGGTFATKGNGSNYCIVPYTDDLLNNFTIQFWIKLDQSDIDNQKRIFGYSSALEMQVRPNGIIRIDYKNEITTETVYSTSTQIAGNWFLVKFTYNSINGGTIYINNVQEDTDNFIGDLNWGGNNPYLFDVLGRNAQLVGILADFRIYDFEYEGAVPTEYYTPTGESQTVNNGLKINEIYKDAYNCEDDPIGGILANSGYSNEDGTINGTTIREFGFSGFITNESPVAIATNGVAPNFGPENAFNTTLDCTGTRSLNSWVTPSNNNTNQRLSLDRGFNPKTIRQILLMNGHDNGNGSSGVKNVKIYVSDDSGDYNTTYNSVTGTMTLIFDGVLDRVLSDEVDFQKIAMTVSEFSERYLIFDCANTYGSTNMSIRQINLFEQESYSLQSNGTNSDFLEIKNDSYYQNDWTMKIKVMPYQSDISAARADICGQWSASGGYVWLLSFEGGIIKLRESDGSARTLNGSAMVAGVISEIQISHSTTNGTYLSLNGVQEDFEAVGITLNISSENPKVMKMTDSADGNVFKGFVADIRVVDKALASVYTVDWNYYSLEGIALIHEVGENVTFAGGGNNWDNSEAVETVESILISINDATNELVAYTTKGQFLDNLDLSAITTQEIIACTVYDNDIFIIWHEGNTKKIARVDGWFDTLVGSIQVILGMGQADYMKALHYSEYHGKMWIGTRNTVSPRDRVNQYDVSDFSVKEDYIEIGANTIRIEGLSSYTNGNLLVFSEGNDRIYEYEGFSTTIKRTSVNINDGNGLEYLNNGIYVINYITSKLEIYNYLNITLDESYNYPVDVTGQQLDRIAQAELTNLIHVFYQYVDYETDQGWSTVQEVYENANWNGTWLTLDQLKAESDAVIYAPYRYFMIKLTTAGRYIEYGCDIKNADLTPPNQVAGEANASLKTISNTYDLITTFVGGEDSGGSSYAGANFEIEIDSVSYYQQSDGSFSTSEIFANLMLIGEESIRDIAYSLEQSVTPQRYRLNSWDNAGNYTRGDWQTFTVVGEDPNTPERPGGVELDAPPQAPNITGTS